MRLVIDLQTCQTTSPDVAQLHVAEAKAIIRNAAQHEVWIVLNGAQVSAIESFRCVLDDTIPQERIMVVELPKATPKLASVHQRICEQVRESAIAALMPDVLYIPNIFDVSDAEDIVSIGELSEGFATIVKLCDISCLPSQTQKTSAPSAQQYRQIASLNNASLVLVSQEQNVQCVIDALDVSPENILYLGVDRNTSNIEDAINTHAQTMWAAFAKAKQIIDVARASVKPNHSKQRHRLAYISPLPPEKSGIADYSAELVPELLRFYDIDLIVAQDGISDDWINTNLPLRSVDWFEQHAHEFDRVLYHFGNSPMHQHMFQLLDRHPGIVVLHDFYLGNILDYLDNTRYLPGAYLSSLYYSHGFSAFADRQTIGATAAVWKYPCNKALLDQARGVIVHSRYPQQLATQWYGDSSTKHWRTLPLLRGQSHKNQAASSRNILGIAHTDFVVCSFGMLGPTKCNDAMLNAWLASPLAHDPSCRLIFVGENDAGKYGRTLQDNIENISGTPNINITGFVSHDDYHHYLAVADVAVQLRVQSRGETSAAILDCLLNGIPTIANAHGSSAELPHEVLWLLPNEFSQDELIDALVTLRQDSTKRANLHALALSYIQREHSPSRVGKQYFDAIEHFTGAQGEQKLLEAIWRTVAPITNNETDLLDVAIAIGANQGAKDVPQLFIDISAMVQLDLKTGIQRVVRSVLKALLDEPPAGYRMEPVYCRGDGSSYRYARQYMANLFGVENFDLDDAPIEAKSGDLFLGLDLFTSGAQKNQSQLQQFRNRGVLLYFVVYDILPILRPQAFPQNAASDFKAWLAAVTQVADGLICISRAVADELAQYLEQSRTPNTKLRRPINIGFFHLGADINASAPSTGLPVAAEEILRHVNSRPSILMVGTIEPRKGHAQSLAAFSELWQKGVAVNLVIVGKQGWMVEEAIKTIQQHPANGTQLFWLAGASDEMLLKLYENADALLAASEGEGFGLPLIEAAQHNIPIIARRLKVFEEVAGQHAFYFEGSSPHQLAEALEEWLRLYATSNAPPSSNMPWLNWTQSTHQLRKCLFERNWYYTFTF